ncbi:MAG: DUF997 family protein [Acidobacteriota bacterium]
MDGKKTHLSNRVAGPLSYAPAFLRARREALIILGAWAVCMIWTLLVCALSGYDLPPGAVKTICGIPSWVFWGVLLPWLAATLFSLWFGLFYMSEDDAGRGQDRADIQQEESSV